MMESNLTTLWWKDRWLATPNLGGLESSWGHDKEKNTWELPFAVHPSFPLAVFHDPLFRKEDHPT